MDSELRPSSKDGKNEIPKSTLDASNKKDDPWAKQASKDGFNKAKRMDGEKQTKEYAPSSLLTNAVTFKMKYNMIVQIVKQLFRIFVQINNNF